MSGICETRYPLLLVHGVASNDRKPRRAWRRIPQALTENGASVYYGGQDSWGSIEKNAELLRQRILDVIAETGAGKVNIIAHSKGGLDARCCISSLSMAQYVASLTTISTPHHGVRTMDTLSKLPMTLYRTAGFFVDHIFRWIGDVDPDFTTTCHQWTTENMRRFNEENPDAMGVYYQSYAARMESPLSDIIMSVPNFVTYRAEGDNDGLVPVVSAKWGVYRGELRGAGKRGVSHVDVVDFRGRDFRGERLRDEGITNILSVYVDIVSELKIMGF